MGPPMKRKTCHLEGPGEAYTRHWYGMVAQPSRLTQSDKNLTAPNVTCSLSKTFCPLKLLHLYTSFPMYHLIPMFFPSQKSGFFGRLVAEPELFDCATSSLRPGPFRLPCGDQLRAICWEGVVRFDRRGRMGMGKTWKSLSWTHAAFDHWLGWLH